MEKLIYSGESYDRNARIISDNGMVHFRIEGRQHGAENVAYDNDNYWAESPVGSMSEERYVSLLEDLKMRGKCSMGRIYIVSDKNENITRIEADGYSLSPPGSGIKMTINDLKP